MMKEPPKIIIKISPICMIPETASLYVTILCILTTGQMQSTQDLKSTGYKVQNVNFKLWVNVQRHLNKPIWPNIFLWDMRTVNNLQQTFGQHITTKLHIYRQSIHLNGWWRRLTWGTHPNSPGLRKWSESFIFVNIWGQRLAWNFEMHDKLGTYVHRIKR